MKSCVIFGDLSSDRAGEQYPTVNFCDACIADEQTKKEDSTIVSVGAYDSSLGNTCECCGKTLEEENAEKAI